MLLSSGAFASLLLMVGYRYSYQILCRPPDLLVDYYLQLRYVLIHWQIFPDIRCLWRMVSSTRCRQPSAFELVSLACDVCCMGFKMPRWVNPMLPLICMDPNFMRVILYWPSVRWACNPTTSPKARSEWKVMHWWSGSRPWTSCSCPWIRCRSYHGSFLQDIHLIVWSFLYH